MNATSVEVSIDGPDAWVSTEFPLVVVSEPNTGGRLRSKLARKSNQKHVVGLQLLAARGWIGLVGLPCTVTLTRIGPKELDDDNLAGAFKVVRDETAKAIGVDDRDPRVRWAYAQEPRARTYAIRIRIERRRERRRA